MPEVATNLPLPNPSGGVTPFDVGIGAIGGLVRDVGGVAIGLRNSKRDINLVSPSEKKKKVNYTPWLIGGGAVVLLVVVVMANRGGK